MSADPLVLVVVVGVLAIGALVVDRWSSSPSFGAVAMISVVGGSSVLSGALRLAAGQPEIVLSTPQVLLGQASSAALIGTGVIAVARGRFPQRGRGLWLSVVVFAGVMVVAELHHASGVSEGALTMALVATAVWTTPRPSVASVCRAAKVVLAAHLLLSAAALLVLPAISTTTELGGVIPGVPFRAYGSLAHPNDLGWIAVLFLLLEAYRPSRPVLRWAVTVPAVALLALSQSKTAWASAALAAAILLWPRLRRGHQAVLIFGVVAVVTLAYRSVFETPGAQEFVRSDRARGLLTLTGRTGLWMEGLAMFLEHPLVGAGPDAFREYAARTGRAWAGQAHNQVIETAATIGLLGLLPLLAYVWQLLRTTIEVPQPARRGVATFVAVLLLRAVTESPLDGMDLGVLVVFAVLVVSHRRVHPTSAAPFDLPAGRARALRPEPVSPAAR